MSQEPRAPEPVDPWADATETEQLTVPAIHPQAPWLPDPTPASVPAPAPARRPEYPTERPPDVLTNEPRRGGRRGPVMVLAVVVVVLLVAGGIVLGRTLANRHRPGSGGTGAQGATSTSATPGATQPSAASDGPSSTDPSGPASAGPSATPGAAAPGRPATRDDALALNQTQALTDLGTEADENGATVAGLAGSFVPQVGGKCVGVSVDIQPSFVPDGTPDTPHVTIQQILAFHLSLHNRFGALTVRQSQLGIGADTATGGPCAGHIIWNSVVPKAFGTAQDANAWCDANVPPVHECLARCVARPGEVSRAVERG